jgi:hypothetical protein
MIIENCWSDCTIHAESNEDAYSNSVNLQAVAAGGIVGVFAGNASSPPKISKCYAKGTITAATTAVLDVYAGGIVGAYGTQNPLKATIEGNAALLTSISTDVTTGTTGIGRIFGYKYNDTATWSDNSALANIAMTITGTNGQTDTPDVGGDKKDGEDIDGAPSITTFTDMGWDFTKVWVWQDGFPVLR